MNENFSDEFMENKDIFNSFESIYFGNLFKIFL